MKMKYSILIAVFGFIIIVSGLVGLYYFEYSRIDYSAIDYIKSMQKSANNFLDLAGDIGVSSYEDLGFEQKSDYDILIHYGKQVIKVNRKCLESEEWRNRVEAIGLKIYSRVNDETEEREYKITYWGEEIDQWSRVD